jgi:hypothetical protein
MTPDHPHPKTPQDESAEDHSPWQFQLRHLLMVMAAASALFATLFAFPDALASALLMILMLILPTSLIAAAIYGKGNTRAFCIGALIPASTQLFTLTVFVTFLLLSYSERSRTPFAEYLERSATGWRAASLATWLLAVFCGALVIAVKDMLERARTGK